MPEQKFNWKMLIRLGAATCGLAVILGAFGAHALESKLTELYEADRAAEKLASWQTGVKYQLVHGLALIAVGLLHAKCPGRWLRLTAVMFLLGVLIFSGGLYVWVLSELKPVVMLVPLGGLAYILGWLTLCCAPLDGILPGSEI